MPDVLTLLFICGMERLGKSLWFSCKVMWVFCKFVCWLTIVPALDCVLLAVALVSAIFCKLFRKKPPKVKHTKRWITYPSWEY